MSVIDIDFIDSSSLVQYKMSLKGRWDSNTR
jgi:hypothetical protein